MAKSTELFSISFDQDQAVQGFVVPMMGMQTLGESRCNVQAEVRIKKTTDLNVRKGQEFDTLMQELQQVRASLGA